MNLANKVCIVLLWIGVISIISIMFIIGIFGIGFADDILAFFICSASVAFCLLSIIVVFFNIDIYNILFNEGGVGGEAMKKNEETAECLEGRRGRNYEQGLDIVSRRGEEDVR